MLHVLHVRAAHGTRLQTERGETGQTSETFYSRDIRAAIGTAGDITRTIWSQVGLMMTGGGGGGTAASRVFNVPLSKTVPSVFIKAGRKSRRDHK